jgi:opacity protein-like surface antigen
MIRQAACCALVLGVILPASVSAQSGLGARGFVTFGSSSFAASESFEAVAGTSRASGWGGGGTVVGLWRGVFVDVAVSLHDLDGERVFVDGGTVYGLGIPVEISIRPLDVAAGWRAALGRVSPYAGAGLSFVSYKERADFALSGDDVDAQESGPLILAGLDISLMRFLFAGVDFRYRSVGGILGAGGVSQVFGEDQLGGATIAVRLSVGR